MVFHVLDISTKFEDCMTSCSLVVAHFMPSQFLPAVEALSFHQGRRVHYKHAAAEVSDDHGRLSFVWALCTHTTPVAMSQSSTVEHGKNVTRIFGTRNILEFTDYAAMKPHCWMPTVCPTVPAPNLRMESSHDCNASQEAQLSQRGRAMLRVVEYFG